MIVVDASVWVSLFLATDQFHEESYRWFVKYSQSSGEIAVPSILLPEVAAALTRQIQDSFLGRETANFLSNLASIHIIAIDQKLAIRAVDVAAECHLRGADSLYVALALSLNVPLLTWDQEQLTRSTHIVKVETPTAFMRA